MERSALVAALEAGDDRAWSVFIDDYGRLIYAVGSRAGLTESELDDHFQTTCVQLVRSIGTLRDPGKLSGWLYSIAYRAAIDLIRQRRKTDTLDDTDGGPEVHPSLAVDAVRRAEAGGAGTHCHRERYAPCAGFSMPAAADRSLYGGPAAELRGAVAAGRHADR